MFLLKACLRCRGDLYQAQDGELVCMQCGHEAGPAEKEAVLQRMAGSRLSEPVSAAKS